MKTLHYGLIALLLITPLLFGSVEPWSLAVMEAFCFFLLAFYAAGNIDKKHEPTTFIKPPLLTTLLLLLGIAVFQMVPLPPPVLKTISPSTYDIYKNTLLYGETLPWLTISLYPQATALESARLASYIAVYCITFQALKDKTAIMRILTAIMVIGSIIALLGIFQTIFNNGKLLWFREFREGTPFGPYVNRNHFAGLMEMIIPICTGMLIIFLPGTRGWSGLRAWLSDIFSLGGTNRFILSFTALAIMITALFLSLSRGGIISLSASMLLFGILLATRKSTKKKGFAILALFVIILFTVGWFGWEPIIERFEKIKEADASSEQRLNNWKDSLNIIKDFPVSGTGFGTYEYIYPKYKTVHGQKKWEHAHNDYIQGAVEFGIPGLLIAGYFIAAFYKKTLLMLRQRKSMSPRLLGIGALTGVTAMLIHSVADFNLHIGANGLYFAFFAAFTLSVSHARMMEIGNGTLLETKTIRLSPKARIPIIAGVLFACLAAPAVPLLNAVSDFYYSGAQGSIDADRETLALNRKRLDSAAALNPCDSRIPFARANIDLALEMNDNALNGYRKAVMLNPVKGEYYQNLGIALQGKGERELAEEYIKLGLRYEPGSAWMRKNYALWLFSANRKDEAAAEMEKAIALEPADTRKFITAMVLGKLTHDEIKEAIPQNATAMSIYGRYREDTGSIDEALEAYLNALSLMKRDGKSSPEIYLRIGSVYEKKEMFHQALAFYEEGSAENPANQALLSSLARLYDKLNMQRKAIEYYKRLLLTAPGNLHAQKRLKELNKER